MTHYLYFNVETGEILSSSNELIKNANYIEIESELHSKFSSGELNFLKYLVVPSLEKDGEYELAEKNKNLLEFDVDKSIHQLVKVNTNTKSNVFIVKQTKEGWLIDTNLEKSYINFLTQNENYVSSWKNIYITEEDNPNILLDVLKFPIKSVLYGSIYKIDEFEKELLQRQDISLYCGTVFENFVHEIGEINE